ncbi:MAG: tetratricopeptide repeat protein [Sulfurovum sp.]
MSVKAILFEDIDATKAIKTCEKSLKKNPNDAHTLFLLARAYSKDKQYKKGFEYALNSCIKGDSGGCTLFGGYYYKGLHTPQDKKRAFLLYLASCTKGNPVACTNIAQMKEKNDPYSKAYLTPSSDLLLDACIRGNYPHGCEIYSNHIYFKKIAYDQERYEYSNYKACINGIEASCKRLWSLYDEYKIPIKEKKLEYVLELSCTNGNKNACENAYR